MSHYFLHHSLTAKVVADWNLTVTRVKRGYSILVKWSVFPLKAPIQEYWVMCKGENEVVSLMFPAGASRSLVLDNFLRAFTSYDIQVFGLTGSILNDSYSSARLTVTSEEAGMLNTKRNYYIQR